MKSDSAENTTADFFILSDSLEQRLSDRGFRHSLRYLTSPKFMQKINKSERPQNKSQYIKPFGAWLSVALCSRDYFIALHHHQEHYDLTSVKALREPELISGNLVWTREPGRSYKLFFRNITFFKLTFSFILPLWERLGGKNNSKLYCI